MEKSFSCDQCHKKFKNNKSIYVHKQICKGQALVPKSSSGDQIAETINNTTNIENQQNNHIQTQNNQNVIVVYNPAGTEFKTDHIRQDAFIKRILETIRPGINHNMVLDYGREILTHPKNKCIQKKSLKEGYSKVHMGENKWNLKMDNKVYPQLASNLANDLSELVYTNQTKIPKQWFKRMIDFLDYMSDEGYINTEDEEQKHQIEKEFSFLVRELKLVIYDITHGSLTMDPSEVSQ